MALAATGLQTQIWNNNLKSTLLLAGYPFLLLAMLWAFLFLTPPREDINATRQWDRTPYAESVTGTDLYVANVNRRFVTYAPLLVLGVGIWFAVAWFAHQSIINGSTGARRLERRDAPNIYNMVENLCISRGMTMPALYMIDHAALNAYASGIHEGSFAITVTRGLVDSLRDDELEAVLAHELSHIRNRDVRLMVVSIIFVGIIAFLCDMAYRTVVYGPRFSSRDERGGGAKLLIGLAVLAVGYLFAILIRFALSRRREYLADAGAVELTHNPDAMIRALRRIEGQSSLGAVSGDVEQLFIDNPPSFMGLFATHPSIDDRVAALIGMGGTDAQPTEPVLPASPWGTAEPAPPPSPWAPKPRSAQPDQW